MAYTAYALCNFARIAAIDVEIVSLTARLNRAKQFTLNPELILECKLLTAQIEALEKYLKQVETR